MSASSYRRNVLVGFVLTLLAGCSLSNGEAGSGGRDWDVAAQDGVSYSMPVYEGVDALTEASDAVAKGVILDSGSKQWDRGKDTDRVNDAPDPSIPVLVYKFRVDDVIASRVKVSKVIDIVIPGNESAGVTRFTQGESFILFLKSFPDSGVTNSREVWVPISYDNGEFVTRGDRAAARSGNVKKLKNGDTPSDGMAVYSIDEMTRVIETTVPQGGLK